jgi:hypothetical protein
MLDRRPNATVPNNNGWTPVNSAANNPHLEVVKLLLDRGADATVPNSNGWTPHLEVVELLLDRGADASRSKISLRFLLGCLKAAIGIVCRYNEGEVSRMVGWLHFLGIRRCLILRSTV